MEAYRALLAADFHPVRAVEFHWYSGEVCTFIKHPLLYVIMFQKEGGLLGSQAIAKDYEARSVNVLAMIEVCPLQDLANN